MASVVADTSPLIALNQIGQLGLLGTIFGTVLVPPAVMAEALSVERPSSLELRALTRPLPSDIVGAGLGPGESQAIGLALELRADRILLDERPGRLLAERLGLPVMGTLGILLLAKRRGVIPAIREPIDSLRGHGFRLSTTLYDKLLDQAGEKQA